MFKLGCRGNVTFIHGFYRLQLLCPYSSSASSLPKVDNSSYLVNYLVSSLGFSKQQSLSNYDKIAKSIASKNASNFYSSFIIKADSAIHFFKQRDFELSHIRKIVCRHPPILCANVDKTLKPKFKILEELGFSGSDIVHTIVAIPSLLHSRLGPKIQALRGILGSDENVRTFLKRSIKLDIGLAAKWLGPNIGLLENAGIPIERIQNIIYRHRHILIKRTDLFRDIMIRVNQELGIPCQSKMFLYGMHLLSNFSDNSIMLRTEMFKSFGWTQSDVLALIRRNPYFLGCNEATIKKKLDFFMNELGYEPAYLISHCFLLSCSLERKVLPRYKLLQLLKEKGLIRMDYPLYNTMCLSESDFLKKIVLPYKEVHEVYAELTGRSLKMQAQGQTCENAIEF